MKCVNLGSVDLKALPDIRGYNTTDVDNRHIRIALHAFCTLDTRAIHFHVTHRSFQRCRQSVRYLNTVLRQSPNDHCHRLHHPISIHCLFIFVSYGVFFFCILFFLFALVYRLNRTNTYQVK